MASERPHLASLLADFDRLGGDLAIAAQHGLRRQATTYRDLAVLARRFGAELERREIRKGERVVLCGENSASWVAAFFGCVMRGVLPVPLDVGSSPEFQRRVTADVQARLCVVDEGRQSTFEGLGPVLRNEATGVHLPSSQADTIADLGEDDPLQIIFTSGTTGEPKGVVHTHGNVLASLRPIESEIGKYRKFERPFHPVRVLHTLPLSHVFGQFMGLWVPGLIGLEIHYRSRVVAAELAAYIRSERMSVLATVPRVLDLLAEHLLATVPGLRERLARAKDWKTWQRWYHFRDVHSRLGWKFWALVCGGAALTEASEGFWGALGFAVIQGYGMTETTALVSLNHPFHPAKGTVGQVLPGREVRLGEDGEVLVRGATISGATWEGGRMQPAPSEWLATGDLAERDEQGNLRFRGRKKDVIVTASGLNVHPEDLETELQRQPNIKRAVILESPGSSAGGPEPFAVLITENPQRVPEDVASANRGLAEYQQIRRWAVWPDADFPRTSTGKVVRREVAARLGSLQPTNADGSLQLDSLGRVELLAKLEAQYGVALPDEAIQNVRSESDVQRVVQEFAGRPPARDEHRYPKWPWSRPMQAVRSLFIRAIAMPLLRFLAAPTIRQLHEGDWPKQPVLIVANHVTSYDAPFVLAALPAQAQRRVAIAMSGEMILDWRKARNQGSWFLNLLAPVEYWLVTALFNIFPLPQRSGFRRSFQHAGEAVDRGYNVLVFPEGRRSETGAAQDFKSGAGLLWKELRVPAVPVRLDGLGDLKVAGRGWFRSGRVVVSRGSTLPAPAASESPEELTERLRQAVFREIPPPPSPGLL